MNLMHLNFFSAILSLKVNYPEWPGSVFISDGGHIENLGLPALIRRKCSKIIICDATEDPNHTCNDFMQSLRICESRLYCSFFSTDNDKSVDFHFQTVFVGNSNRARFFTFKVRYYDGTEGTIVYLKPKSDKIWHGICCDCCKGFSCFSLLCGKFPQHSTAQQFFSPGLYALYQDEGFNAYEEYKEFCMPPLKA